MKALSWMNSVITKYRKKILCALISALLSGILSGCALEAIPERIVGGIVRDIIARDYDLWYAPTEEEAEGDNPESPALADNRTSDIKHHKPEDGNGPETGKEEEEEPETGKEEKEEEAEKEEGEENEDGGYGEYEDPGDAEEEDEEEENSVSENSSDQAYYFSTMSAPEKKLYLEIYNAIVTMSEQVTLSTTDKDEVDRIFNLCLMDHPEIFYCDGYRASVSSVEDRPVSIGFEGKFNVSREERKEKEEKIKAAAEKALKGVPEDDSDYEKAKYVFEWIIDNTAYDIDSPDNQNISSVFLNGRSVCQGYTYAYKYLLNRLGIFCTIVYGEAVSSNHAWNLARLDGTYCYIDVTWGDSSYRDKDDNEANRTSYNYFGCNSEILLRTHTLNNRGTIPECTSLDEYYYVKEAKYFTKVDMDRLRAVFDHEAEKGEHMFTIRASSEEVYNELCDTLFEKKEVFNLVPDAASVTYIEDKDEYTLTFTV